ncbi:hypothetical protein K469DRAFT_753593 [Zopfia rhizophila CBS 207.26]|uniref:Transcription factor domain-containing protein n=1 Tax=Zopfia rhizophila CBS 207.26 TaxID=1314779 RepID=A0A6A6DPF0_9PEZI|nr:hypothetical protein K469DRAFT_753593 [Zopfia rhizophila CBS 207.26]
MFFQFVNNATIDAKARKAIRSHVMRGRNAGKTITRPSRFVHKKNRETRNLLTRQNFEEKESQRANKLFAIHQVVGHQLSSLSFPVKPSRHIREAIHLFFTLVVDAVYPHKYCTPFEPEQTLWLHYMTVDTAYFHCTLSVMAAGNDFYLEQPGPSPFALTHLSETFQLVTAKLSGPEALSDMTVTLVYGLVIYSQLRGENERWRIHMDGLHRLVELRGGLDQFSGSPTLLQKICRADIDFALANGCSTRFSSDQVPFLSARIGRSLISEFHHVSPLPSAFQRLKPSLQLIAIDIMALTDTLNHSTQGRKVDALTYQEALITIFYRLLHTGPWNNIATDCTFDICCYLGILSFMTTLMFQYGRRRLLRPEMLTRRLKAALQHDGYTCDWGGVKLWLLIVGRISILRDEDDSWILSQTADELKKLGIGDWENLSRELNRFPWIETLHGIALRRIWGDRIFNFRIT